MLFHSIKNHNQDRFGNLKQSQLLNKITQILLQQLDIFLFILFFFFMDKLPIQASLIPMPREHNMERSSCEWMYPVVQRVTVAPPTLFNLLRAISPNHKLHERRLRRLHVTKNTPNPNQHHGTVCFFILALWFLNSKWQKHIFLSASRSMRVKGKLRESHVDTWLYEGVKKKKKVTYSFSAINGSVRCLLT